MKTGRGIHSSPRHNACILDGSLSKKLPDWINLQYFSSKLLKERTAPCKPRVQTQQKYDRACLAAPACRNGAERTKGERPTKGTYINKDEIQSTRIRFGTRGRSNSRARRAGRSQPSRCGDRDSRSQRESRYPAGKGLLSQGSARSEYDRGDPMDGSSENYLCFLRTGGEQMRRSQRLAGAQSCKAHAMPSLPKPSSPRQEGFFQQSLFVLRFSELPAKIFFSRCSP
jgi:hypothetical protein